MDAPYPLTDAEKQQWLRDGRPVLYPACAPPGVSDWDSLRTIHAGWIRAVFDAKTRVCDKPVKIENAIIANPLYLQHFTAEVGFRISGSIFREPVDFSNFTARGGLDLQGSRFERTSGKSRTDCSFRFARCERDLILDGVRFDVKASFRSLDVMGNVQANGVCFADDADFVGSRLGRDIVSFAGATFGGIADFRRTRITGNLYFGPSFAKETARTVFWGRARYEFLRVDGRVSFEGACFQGDASFEAIEVDGTAQFRAAPELGVPCSFLSNANFLDAVVRSNLDLNGVDFRKGANFIRLRVGHTLFCRSQLCGGRPLQPTFRGIADFSDATVERNVSFAGVRFGRLARFDRMQAGTVWFSTAVIGSRRLRTVFAKGLEMRQAKIGGALICSGVQFAGAAYFTSTQISGGAYFQPLQVTEKPRTWFPTRFRNHAVLDFIEIGGVADFTGVEFRGDASWQRGKIAGSAYFGRHYSSQIDSEFRGRARLSGLQAESDIYFDGARFCGTALFTGMEIAGNTFFRNAGDKPVQFLRHADFVDVTLAGNADFSGARFGFGADFRRADIGRLGLFRSVHFGDPEWCKPVDGSTSGMCPSVFTNSTFGGDADFMGAIFSGPAKLDGIVVKGLLGLEFTQFRDSASLDRSIVASALFRDDPQRGPTFQRPPKLRAFTFDRVSADWRQLFPKGRQSDGDSETEAFSRFEKFYLSVGDQDKADEVYLERRRLRRLSFWNGACRRNFKFRETPRRISHAFRWAWDYFVEYWLLNYGVPTKRLLGWSLILACLGVAMLATIPEAMTERRAKQEVRLENGKLEFTEAKTGHANRSPWARRWLTATGAFSAAVLPGEKAAALSQWEPSDQPLFPWAKWPVKQVISSLGYMISFLVGIALAGLGRLLKGRG